MSGRLPAMETVRMALTTLRGNRLRSLLTMLGIVIGNASVITLVGVGRGAQGLAEEQLSNLGANVLFVVPGNNDTRRRGVAFPKTLVLQTPSPVRYPVSNGLPLRSQAARLSKPEHDRRVARSLGSRRISYRSEASKLPKDASSARTIWMPVAAWL